MHRVDVGVFHRANYNYVSFNKRANIQLDFWQMIDFSTHTTENGTLVVRLGGRLDGESTEYFFNCIGDEIARGNDRIVINCSDLGYISSVGLGALIRARSRVSKTGGKIYFARVDAAVMNVLHMVRLDTIFEFFEKERDAIATMES